MLGAPPRIGTDLGPPEPTSTQTSPDPTSSPSSGTPGTTPPAAEGRTCGTEPPGDNPPTASPSPLPPDIQQVADQVEEMRNRDFQRPVFPEAVSESEMAQRITDAVDQSLPVDELVARQLAWATLGAIPASTDLRQAYLDYYSSQVLGFYDTESDELVFIGSDTLSPLDRDILSHELTHALDDQSFHLERVDQLLYACRDEEANAFVALIEGNATYHQQLWASTYLSPEEIAQLLLEAGQIDAPPPASVPTFVQQMEAFPYNEGLAFASALVGSGGEDAIDAALEHPPVSTEQILHPNLYPSDEPRAVTVPDRSAGLGAGWTAGDVLDVGEEFLRLLLNQRIGEAEARTAAAGWDGGQYAAWVQGDRVAVELDTVWDTPAQAAEFAQAVEDYGSGSAVSVTRDGDRVVALFGSDREALEALQAAAA